MTLQALTERLYHQLDLPQRTEARDMQTILKALKEAQAIKPKKRRKK